MKSHILVLFFFCLLSEPCLINIVFCHNLLEPEAFLLPPVLEFSLLSSKLFLDLINKQFVELFVLLLFLLSPFVFVLDLLISHLLLQVDLTLTLSPLLLFALVIVLHLLRL